MIIFRRSEERIVVAKEQIRTIGIQFGYLICALHEISICTNLQIRMCSHINLHIFKEKIIKILIGLNQIWNTSLQIFNRLEVHNHSLHVVECSQFYFLASKDLNQLLFRNVERQTNSVPCIISNKRSLQFEMHGSLVILLNLGISLKVSIRNLKRRHGVYEYLDLFDVTLIGEQHSKRFRIQNINYKFIFGKISYFSRTIINIIRYLVI